MRNRVKLYKKKSPIALRATILERALFREKKFAKFFKTATVVRNSTSVVIIYIRKCLPLLYYDCIIKAAGGGRMG